MSETFAETRPPSIEQLGTSTIRVLCVDSSLGFGGATKSLSLLFRNIPAVEPVILTSQDAYQRQLWWGGWPTFRFRRFINYRSRWRMAEWLRRRNAPQLLRAAAGRIFSMVDRAVELGNAVRITWLLKKHRIDLLHLSNGLAPREALLAGRLMGVPSIVHLRGFFPSDSESARRSASWAAQVIGDSDAVTSSFRRASGAAVPSTTIYEVVDVARFDASAGDREAVRAKLDIRQHDVAVGLFGRIVPWKGQKEFVRAVFQAMEQDRTIIGVLVGDAADGVTSYFDEVEQLIESSGKSDRFRLTGYIQDVEPFYAAMDIVVHASVEPEPCGMVVLEGMAAKRPVIAANEGGPKELIRDGVDGYLADPGDVRRLREAILALAADPSRRHRMGESGYRRASERYDVPIAAARLRSLYEQILSPGHPRSE